MRWQRMDAVVLVWTVLVVAGQFTKWGGHRWGTAIDTALYGLLGPGLAFLQWRLGDSLPIARERQAWRFFAVASVARALSGIVWSQWLVAYPGEPLPLWLLLFKWTYLVFNVAALLSFPSTLWRADDRSRYRLDLATALVGSLLLVWFFALGPFFSSRALTPDFVDDFVHAAGDSLTVMLAAALHLRAATRLTRLLALPLLVAFILQVIPDIVFWSSTGPIDPSLANIVGLLWFAVWLVKWFAVRIAGDIQQRADVKDWTHEADTSESFETSSLPAAFLVAATSLLLWTLLGGPTAQRTGLALGSAVLAALLVGRQSVELRARDRLQRDLQADSARQRALLHRAYDALVLIDDQGRLQYASPVVQRLFGDRVNTNEPWAVLSQVHPADVDRIRTAITHATAEPQAITVRARDDMGEWRVFEGYLQDRRADPLIQGYVLNGLDRTREVQLARGLEDAQQFEALGVMASGLAHDLGNILTVIASHVELLRDDDTLPPQASADLQSIRAASDRARALTFGLLTLSRRKSASTMIVAAERLVQERLLTRSARQTVGVISLADGAAVRADAETLTQVLDAVLDEAHTERIAGDTPTVLVDTRDLDSAEAEVLHVEPGRYVIIGVGDSDANRFAQRQPTNESLAMIVEHAVSARAGGEWDLSPSDLAMLMALAAAREMGGTVARERTGSAHRLAIYMPAVMT